MPDLTSLLDEKLRAEAASAGRAALETALERFSLADRDAFWNAIGLYYAQRRHPGADIPETPPRVAVAV